MNGWLMLAGAILSEVTGTLAMRASGGFQKLWPSLVVAVCYGIAVFLLAMVLRAGIPVSIAYAIWASLGIALVALGGWAIFGETLTVQSLIGMAFIVVGVVLVETGSS